MRLVDHCGRNTLFKLALKDRAKIFWSTSIGIIKQCDNHGRYNRGNINSLLNGAETITKYGENAFSPFADGNEALDRDRFPEWRTPAGYRAKTQYSRGSVEKRE